MEFRSGGAPGHLKGAQHLHPKWSNGALAAAAAAAAEHHAQASIFSDSRTSEPSRTSDQFLMEHHQFSRESHASEVSFPPPPPDDSRNRADEIPFHGFSQGLLSPVAEGPPTPLDDSGSQAASPMRPDVQPLYAAHQNWSPSLAYVSHEQQYANEFLSTEHSGVTSPMLPDVQPTHAAHQNWSPSLAYMSHEQQHANELLSTQHSDDHRSESPSAQSEAMLDESHQQPVPSRWGAQLQLPDPPPDSIVSEHSRDIGVAPPQEYSGHGRDDSEDHPGEWELEPQIYVHRGSVGVDPLAFQMESASGGETPPRLPAAPPDSLQDLRQGHPVESPRQGHGSADLALQESSPLHPTQVLQDASSYGFSQVSAPQTVAAPQLGAAGSNSTSERAPSDSMPTVPDEAAIYLHVEPESRSAHGGITCTDQNGGVLLRKHGARRITVMANEGLKNLHAGRMGKTDSTNSFRVTRIPEAFGGLVMESSAGRDVTAFCRNMPGLGFPLLTFFVGLVFLCGFASLLWYIETPIVAKGAFGLITQTGRSSTIDFSYFSKMQQSAIASLAAFNPGSDAKEDQDLAWHHVEFIYEIPDGGLVSDAGIAGAKDIEKRFTGLSGWQRFCGKVRAQDRHFCSSGDSLPSVLFGVPRPVDSSLKTQGALEDVVLDGSGFRSILPFDAFVSFLRNFYDHNLQRWLALSSSSMQYSPVRSTFAFHLLKNESAEFKAFVQKELGPALLEEVKSAYEKQFLEYNHETNAEDELKGKIRTFYRVDGLWDQEFRLAVAEDNDWRGFAPGGAFLGTFLATRRFFLSCTAALLSVTACAIGSTLLATRNDMSGEREYPVIAVASWFIIAVSCTDLAIACSCNWLSPRDTFVKCPGRLGRLPVDAFRRMSRFLFDVPVPLMSAVTMMAIIGSFSDLPVVKEFTSHTCMGVIVAIVFSMILFPPAIEISEALHRESMHSEFLKSFSGRLHGFVPLEIGGPPKFFDEFRGSSLHIAKILKSRVVFGFSALAMLVVIIASTAPSSSPDFTGITPELFHKGHRIRDFPKVLRLFGSDELPTTEEAPAETMRSLQTCQPDAHGGINCSWYRCEVDNAQKPEKNKCTCYKQLGEDVLGKPSRLEHCGAAARFFGLDTNYNAFVRSNFWRWAEENLGGFITNKTRSIAKSGPLEMEDWLTGLVTTDPHVTVHIPGADGSKPMFESACLRVMCFCGPKMCKIDASKWQSMGVVTHAGAGNRALWSSSGTASPKATSVVYVIFGMKKVYEIPSMDQRIVGYDSQFDFINPWTQRSMLEFCLGTAPNLTVVSRQCWIYDFKRWLEGQGKRFPLKPTEFYTHFENFLAFAASRSSQPLAIGADSPMGSSMKSGYNYFWLSKNNTIKSCFFSFAVAAPTLSDSDAVSSYRKNWGYYMWSRKVQSHPGYGWPWMASPLFAAWESALAVKDAAKLTIAATYLITMSFTLMMTLSFRLTAAVLATLSICLGLMAIISILVSKREFGTIELIGLAVFTGSLMPPMIRVSYQYSIAQDGPGDKPLPKEVVDEFMAHSSKERHYHHQESSEGMPHAHHSHATDIKRTSLLNMFHFMSQDVPEQMFLVDNRSFGARTVGLGYRLSPRLGDIDSKANGNKNLAPWGSTVKGTPCGSDWVQVGKRFLPRHLNNVEVLSLQADEGEGESSDEDEYGDRLTLDFLKDLWIGTQEQHKLWAGCCRAERMRRVGTVFKRSVQNLLGTSIAGTCVGIGMIPLRLQALSQIGLANLCAAITLPPMVLGLLPVLILGWFGPTRVGRSALLVYVNWIKTGKPRGFNPDTEEAQGQDGRPSSHSGGSSCSRHDWRAPGEIAAEELGFPFTLSLRGLTEHWEGLSFSGITDRDSPTEYDEDGGGDARQAEVETVETPSPHKAISPSSSNPAIDAKNVADRWNPPPATSEQRLRF